MVNSKTKIWHNNHLSRRFQLLWKHSYWVFWNFRILKEIVKVQVFLENYIFLYKIFQLISNLLSLLKKINCRNCYYTNFIDTWGIFSIHRLHTYKSYLPYMTLYCNFIQNATGYIFSLIFFVLLHLRLALILTWLNINLKISLSKSYKQTNL